jgi:hypothetical protein
MLRVYTHPDRVLVGMIADIVERSGFACYIKNEFIGGGAGDIPPQECWPELWLLDERDEHAARALIATVTPATLSGGSPWQCSQCGEWIEPQFAACWHCGSGGVGA